MKYHLQTLAETGTDWADFGPYVPCLSETGAVAFQATLSAGGSGLYLAHANEITCLYESALGPFSHFYSHPDFNENQTLCFYATRPHQVSGVYLSRGKQLTPLAETGDRFDMIGPLGPTLNAKDTVAFRAVQAGQAGIFKAATANSLTEIAKTGSFFKAFQGLPVLNKDGDVLFRADLENRQAGLFYWRNSEVFPLLLTGERFQQLGAFPAWNNAGSVVFAATLHTGESGIFRLNANQPSETVQAVLSSACGMEHFRGALINDAEDIIYFASSPKGGLGLFTGPDPAKDKLLSIGDSWQMAQVTEFALNAVSFNHQGQIALRIKLSNGQGLILRADPV